MHGSLTQTRSAGRICAVLGTLGAALAGCGRSSLDSFATASGTSPAVSSSSSSSSTGAGGSACAPTPEVCNGVDDDCDGVVDNGNPGGGASCAGGLPGPCGAGITVCKDGAIACVGASPSPETCNGLDDDCDGAVDNGNPGGGGACDTGKTGACSVGMVSCKNAALGCVATTGPTTETCNGLDDDCNGVTDDPPACARRVFVTSTIFQGNLGGLAGADAKCQALADAVSLGGTYKAWLSTKALSAKDRLSHLGSPYVLVDGTVVAADWGQFASENHEHAIDLTETFGAPPWSPAKGLDWPIVFTATLWDGSVYPSAPNAPAYTCGDWTKSTNAEDVLVGAASFMNGGWTVAADGFLCHEGAALYCVEQ